MTTCFVTVGMSLLTSSRCWNGLEAIDAFSASELRQPEAIAEHLERLMKAEQTRWDILGQLTDQDSFPTQANRVVHSHADRIRSCWTSRRPYLLPAELATLFKIRRSIQTGDRIVVLCGTGENLKVGFLLASMAKLIFTQALIEVMGGYQWDPVNDTNFSIGITSLWRDLTQRMRQLEAPLVFVFTGGYKVLLTELTARIVAEPINATLYYLNEDVSEDVITTRIVTAGERTDVRSVHFTDQGTD